MIPVTFLVGAGVDYARATAVKAKIQTATDAAVLAVIREVPTLRADADFQSRARAFFDASFPPQAGVTVTRFTPTRAGTQVTITATAQVEMTLGRLMHPDPLEVSGASQAMSGGKAVEIALVLDNTGSMNDSGKLAAMKTSGNDFTLQPRGLLKIANFMADTGVQATQHLLQDLKRRVKETGTQDPQAVKALLADAIAELLQPLQAPLVIGQHSPTVIMVAGVNGAGKTTSIGKLTRHLCDQGASVLLAAADTFRAAAREQLGVWADRTQVDIVSQEGGDPAAVSFDAVSAGRARGRDVVLVDTAGRLPTQLHLMDELKKIKRVVQKADASAPHEVLLVIDGNTGQNALAQVKAFDEALDLTGLVVTKLDGTAKGGVLAAIALWSRERSLTRGRGLAVYFIGVGEQLQDLERFDAREFAQALLG